MKKVIFLAMLVASFSLISCEKEQHAENLTVESYADFELIGGSPYILPIGTTWVDPGVKATVNGEDVSSEIITVDGVDDTTIGSYVVKYKYVNKDGFSNSASRTVYVCNPAVTIDLAGTYTTIAGTYREDDQGNTVDYPGHKVKIKKICPGFFAIDDLLAQFYSVYYGYADAYPGYDFDADANLSLNVDNSIDLVSGGYTAAFGAGVSALTNALYDPATETVSFVAKWKTYDFHVVMKKDN